LVCYQFFELTNWVYRILLIAQFNDDVVVFDVQRISHLKPMCLPTRHMTFYLFPLSGHI